MKYGLVSNLARIFEFPYEKRFHYFTFNFYYRLFSMFFIMLLKQLSVMKKNVFQGRRLQKSSLNLGEETTPVVREFQNILRDG